MPVNVSQINTQITGYAIIELRRLSDAIQVDTWVRRSPIGGMHGEFVAQMHRSQWNSVWLPPLIESMKKTEYLQDRVSEEEWNQLLAITAEAFRRLII